MEPFFKISPNVISVHVELWSALDNPLGQLLTAPTTQHHAGRVEAAAIKEASDFWVLACTNPQ